MATANKESLRVNNVHFALECGKLASGMKSHSIVVPLSNMSVEKVIATFEAHGSGEFGGTLMRPWAVVAKAYHEATGNWRYPGWGVPARGDRL